MSFYLSPPPVRGIQSHQTLSNRLRRCATLDRSPSVMMGKTNSPVSVTRQDGLIYWCPSHSSYLNTCQSLPTWQSYFNHPSGTRLGLFSASAYLPSLVLLPLFSICCDRFGRRISAAIGAVFVIIGAIVGALAKGDGMLYVGRILVGTPGSLLVLGANLLLNEILHPRLRSIGGALFLTAYYTGSTVAAWTGYGVLGHESMGDWAWR